MSDGIGSARLERALALLQTIFGPGVEVPSRTILQIGTGHRLDRHVMFAAKKALGIQSRQVNGSWVWFREPSTDSTVAPSARRPPRPSRPAVPAAFGSRIEQAEAFLDGLFRPGVALDSRAVLAAAEAEGISRHPLFDAKKKLGILTRPGGGPGAGWVWYRAGSEDDPPIT